MKVYIPSPLQSYTERQTLVHTTGSTIAEVLFELDRQFPGIRFRIINEQDQIREHIRIFVNEELIQSLETPVKPTDSIHVIAALSGGCNQLTQDHSNNILPFSG